MKRSVYKNFVWYPVTDENYYVEEYPEEFLDCLTILFDESSEENDVPLTLYTRDTTYMGWGTMAKSGTWKFMIIPIK